MTTEQIPEAAATLVNQTSGKRLWMKVRLVWPHNVMILFYFVTDGKVEKARAFVPG